MKRLKMIYYYSGGSFVQHINKKNLCFHKVDLNINAEQHFLATAHDKGNVMVVVVQLEVSSQGKFILSICKPNYNKIYLQWTVQDISSVNFTYITQDEY